MKDKLDLNLIVSAAVFILILILFWLILTGGPK